MCEMINQLSVYFENLNKIYIYSLEKMAAILSCRWLLGGWTDGPHLPALLRGYLELLQLINLQKDRKDKQRKWTVYNAR